MKKVALLLAMLMLMVSGCASTGWLGGGRVVGKVPQIGNDFATVYIARKGGGWVGCGGPPFGRTGYLIQINDQDFIRLECGMKTSFKIPVGEIIKIAGTSTVVHDEFFLTPKNGDVYYFATDCNPWLCWFDMQTKEDYDKYAATCHKELSIEQSLKKEAK